jgi:putative alpha-1,2-mannosidase
VKTAVVKLENGRTLTIRAEGQSDRNVYVKGVTLNERPLDRPYVTHSELMSGGMLVFRMNNETAR